MKVSLYDQIKTLVDIQGDFSTHETSDNPKGTQGTVVEFYENPKGYLDVQADFSTRETPDNDNRVIPKGTLGTVVECYENPEGYAVDIAIPDERLVGGFCYTNVILTPEQFEVVSTVTASFG